MLSYAPPLQGSTTPRLFTPPLVQGPSGPCGCGCALTPATSLGFSAVDFARDVIGIEPLPWQRWLLIHALELRPDGRFRFRTVLVLVGRQNGKTSIVEVKNLWKMFVLQVPLVIGTAQNLDISEESWDKAVEIVESVPELASEVAHVDKTNGKKALKLAHGSRWKIAAASRKGGRGLSGDDVNLDELREHQSWESWGAVTKTTMARRNAQVWAFSNAGDKKSIVLNDLQGKGRAAAERLVKLLARIAVAEAEAITRAAVADGIDITLGHFEWSAGNEVACTCRRQGEDPHGQTCRLRDRRAWAQANPSLGYTITEEAVESALNTDPEPIFRTEVLCQRVPDLAGTWQVIPEADWAEACDPNSQLGDELALAVSVSWDRTRASICAAGPRADGLMHGETVENKAGTGWVVKRLVELVKAHRPSVVVVNPGGPAGSLIPDIEAELVKLAEARTPILVELKKVTSRETAQAFGMIYDWVCGKPYIDDGGQPVNPRNFRHIGDEELSGAVAVATKRQLGDGHAWDLKDATGDVTPVDGVTLALLGYATRPAESGPVRLEGSLMA